MPPRPRRKALPTSVNSTWTALARTETRATHARKVLRLIVAATAAGAAVIVRLHTAGLL